MSFNIRRRLSSIVAPFTVSRPSTDNDAAERIRAGSVSYQKRATFNEKAGDDSQSSTDESSRKSYALSEIASRRSFDTSQAGSEINSDDESRESYSGTSDASWDSDTDQEVEHGDKYDLMASHLYQVAEGKGWFRSSKAWGNSTGIVSIR